MDIGMVEAAILDAVGTDAATVAVVATAAADILREGSGELHLSETRLTVKQNGMGNSSRVGHLPQELLGLIMPLDILKSHKLA